MTRLLLLCVLLCLLCGCGEVVAAPLPVETRALEPTLVPKTNLHLFLLPVMADGSRLEDDPK